MSAANALQQHIGQHAVQAGKALKLRVRLSSFDAVCAMVGHGVGVGVVPEAAARRCKRTTAIRISRLTDSWSHVVCMSACGGGVSCGRPPGNSWSTCARGPMHNIAPRIVVYPHGPAVPLVEPAAGVGGDGLACRGRLRLAAGSALSRGRGRAVLRGAERLGPVTGSAAERCIAASG